MNRLEKQLGANTLPPDLETELSRVEQVWQGITEPSLGGRVEQQRARSASIKGKALWLKQAQDEAKSKADQEAAETVARAQRIAVQSPFLDRADTLLKQLEGRLAEKMLPKDLEKEFMRAAQTWNLVTEPSLASRIAVQREQITKLRAMAQAVKKAQEEAKQASRGTLDSATQAEAARIVTLAREKGEWNALDDAMKGMLKKLARGEVLSRKEENQFKQYQSQKNFNEIQDSIAALAQKNLRSEMRGQSGAQVIENSVSFQTGMLQGVLPEMPIDSFLRAFGIDPDKAKIKALDDKWGRIEVAQHPVLGLKGNDLRQAVLDAAFGIFISLNVQITLAGAYQSILKRGLEVLGDIYLLTYEGTPAALVWPVSEKEHSSGVEENVMYYPLHAQLQPLFYSKVSPELNEASLRTTNHFRLQLESRIKALHQVDGFSIFDATRAKSTGEILDPRMLVQWRNGSYLLPGTFNPEDPSTIVMLRAIAMHKELKLPIVGEKVVEIGSGSGRLTSELLQMGASKVYAYDITPMKVLNTLGWVRGKGVQDRLAARVANTVKVFPPAKIYVWNPPDVWDEAPRHGSWHPAHRLFGGENVMIHPLNLKKELQDIYQWAPPDALFVIRHPRHPSLSALAEKIYKETGWEPDPSRICPAATQDHYVYILRKQPGFYSRTSAAANVTAVRSEVRAGRMSKNAREILDADTLSNYVRQLVKGINRAAEPGKEITDSMIVKEPQKYAQDFYKPLYQLFFLRLLADFSHAINFVARASDILDREGAHALREAMNKPKGSLQKYFGQIRRTRHSHDVSMDLYGKLLFYLLGKDSDYYLGHLYDELIQTRPEIAIARQGISYHTNTESTIRLHDKGILYGTDTAIQEYKNIRDTSFDTTHLTERQNTEHARKIAKAIEYWKARAIEMKSDVLLNRISNFEKFSVVIEFDSSLPYILVDPQTNVVRLIHSERLTHALYLSAAYLESLDIGIPEDIKELALWLNFGQEWLDIYSEVFVTPPSKNGRSREIQNAIEEERMKLNTHFFDIEDSGLIPTEALKARMITRMRKQVLERYRFHMDFVITEEEEAARFLRDAMELAAGDPLGNLTGNQRFVTRDKFMSLLAVSKRLLNRYEAMGMHTRSEEIFRQIVYATAGIQLYDIKGVLPHALQMELIFIALRLGYWADFLNELEIFLTARPDPRGGISEEILQGELRLGYPRKMTRGNIEEMKLLLNVGWFEPKLKFAMEARLLATPPQYLAERGGYVQKANRMLAEFFEHPFENLDPNNIVSDFSGAEEPGEDVRSEMRTEEEGRRVLHRQRFEALQRGGWSGLLTDVDFAITDNIHRVDHRAIVWIAELLKAKIRVGLATGRIYDKRKQRIVSLEGKPATPPYIADILENIILPLEATLKENKEALRFLDVFPENAAYGFNETTQEPYHFGIQPLLKKEKEQNDFLKFLQGIFIKDIYRQLNISYEKPVAFFRPYSVSLLLPYGTLQGVKNRPDWINARIAEIRSYFEKQGIPVEVVWTGTTWDILSEGASKQNAVRRYETLLGRDHFISIDDQGSPGRNGIALTNRIGGISVDLFDETNPDVVATKELNGLRGVDAWLDVVPALFPDRIKSNLSRSEVRDEEPSLKDEMREEILRKMLEEVVSLPPRGVVLMGGPTASGKSTLIEKILEALRLCNRNLVTVSVDNFLVPKEQRPFYLGRFSLDHLDSYDRAAVLRITQGLLKGNAEILPPPLFAKDRTPSSVMLGERDVLGLDGLHVLDSSYRDALSGYELLSVFVTAPHPLRFLRRLERDSAVRKIENPVKFLELWQHARLAEEEFVFPSQAYAKFVIDQDNPREILARYGRMKNTLRSFAAESGILGRPELLSTLEEIHSYARALESRSELRAAEEKKPLIESRSETQVEKVQVLANFLKISEPKPAYPQIFDLYDPSKVEVELLINPAPSGRYTFDHVLHKLRWDRREGIRNVDVPWGDLEVPLAERLGKDISRYTVYSSHNTYHNDWFVAYDGKQSRLFHRMGEPFDARTYSMLVIWNDRKASFEDLRFEKVSDEPPTIVQVYRASDATKTNLASQIKFALFGQRIIRQGNSVPVAELAAQWVDIFHLYRLPVLAHVEGDGTLYGEPVGLKELMTGPANPVFPEDRPVLKKVLEQDGYAEIDLNPYLIRSYRASYTLNQIEADMFRRKTYVSTDACPPAALKEGQYFIDGRGILHIRLRRSFYPHNLLGITKSGKIAAIVLTGDKMERNGYTLAQVQDVVREGMKQRNDPIMDLAMIANSKDAFKRVNGVFVQEESSPIVYEGGTAAIAMIEPVSAAEARSEVRSGLEGERKPVKRHGKDLDVKQGTSEVLQAYFYARTPVLWRELLTSYHNIEVERARYFERLSNVSALASVFERLSSSDPDTHLVRILEKALDDFQIKQRKDWEQSLKDLLRWIRILKGKKQGKKLNFPLKNIAYQALIEMVRQWPKKERHTHITASIPEEMILWELAERQHDFRYRINLEKIMDKKMQSQIPERVIAMRKFRELLAKHADWHRIPVNEFMEIVDNRYFRGTRDVRDLWVDAITDPEERQIAAIDSIERVLMQNFADGITDLELFINPFFTTQITQASLHRFLKVLLQRTRDIEAFARETFGREYFTSFTFSFDREKMRGPSFNQEAWDKSFHLLKALREKNEVGAEPGRFKGIGIAGIEPFEWKGTEAKTVQSVKDDLHLAWLANWFKVFQAVGYETTTHLGDFAGASPGTDSRGHLAFVKAHLDVLGKFLDRIGHGRIFTPGLIRYLRHQQDPASFYWKQGTLEHVALLKRVQKLGLTIESTPANDMLNVVTLRHDYPNYWWAEPKFKLNVIYGSDGFYGAQPITLSQWLVRLMLASPTSEDSIPGRTHGMTIRAIKEQVIDSRSEIRSSLRTEDDSVRAELRAQPIEMQVLDFNLRNKAEIWDDIVKIEQVNMGNARMPESILKNIFQNPKAIMVGAFDETTQKLIGYTLGIPLTDIPIPEERMTNVHSQKVLYILTRQVLPEWQKQGIGNLLRQRLFDQAAREGYAFVSGHQKDTFTASDWQRYLEELGGLYRLETLKHLSPMPPHIPFSEQYYVVNLHPNLRSEIRAEPVVFDHPIIFKSRDGAKTVSIPPVFLQELQKIAQLKAKLDVELEATLYVKNGIVYDIDYPRDETKFAVIRSLSQDEFEVTENVYYFSFPAYLLREAKELAGAIQKADVKEKTERLAESKAILSDLAKAIKEYRVRIELFSVKSQARYELVPGQLEQMTQFSEDMIRDLLNIDYAVTTWIGARNLRGQSHQLSQKPDEIIEIHSHPQENPAPPSAIRKEDGTRIGDIYNAGFWKGVIQGNILHTLEGDELILFYEPREDDHRMAAYEKIYDLYWFKAGNPEVSKESAAIWNPGKGSYERSVNERIALEQLRQLAMTDQNGERIMLTRHSVPDIVPRSKAHSKLSSRADAKRAEVRNFKNLADRLHFGGNTELLERWIEDRQKISRKTRAVIEEELEALAKKTLVRRLEELPELYWLSLVSMVQKIKELNNDAIPFFIQRSMQIFYEHWDEVIRKLKEQGLITKPIPEPMVGRISVSPEDLVYPLARSINQLLTDDEKNQKVGSERWRVILQQYSSLNTGDRRVIDQCVAKKGGPLEGLEKIQGDNITVGQLVSLVGDAVDPMLSAYIGKLWLNKSIIALVNEIVPSGPVNISRLISEVEKQLGPKSEATMRLTMEEITMFENRLRHELDEQKNGSIPEKLRKDILSVYHKTLGEYANILHLKTTAGHASRNILNTLLQGTDVAKRVEGKTLIFYDDATASGTVAAYAGLLAKSFHADQKFLIGVFRNGMPGGVLLHIDFMTPGTGISLIEDDPTWIGSNFENIDEKENNGVVDIRVKNLKDLIAIYGKQQREIISQEQFEVENELAKYDAIIDEWIKAHENLFNKFKGYLALARKDAMLQLERELIKFYLRNPIFVAHLRNPDPIHDASSHQPEDQISKLLFYVRGSRWGYFPSDAGELEKTDRFRLSRFKKEGVEPLLKQFGDLENTNPTLFTVLRDYEKKVGNADRVRSLSALQEKYDLYRERQRKGLKNLEDPTIRKTVQDFLNGTISQDQMRNEVMRNFRLFDATRSEMRTNTENKIRKQLGTFKERIDAGKFTVEAEMSPPLLGSRDSFGKYLVRVQRSNNSYEAGDFDAVTERDAPDLSDWMIERIHRLARKLNDLETKWQGMEQKNIFLKLFFGSFLSPIYYFRVNGVLGMMRDLGSDMRRHVSLSSLPEVPKGYTATIATQMRSQNEIINRIAMAVHGQGARFLTVVSGGHPVRKILRWIFRSWGEVENIFSTNAIGTLRIISEMKRKEQIPQSVRVAIGWDIYSEPDLKRLNQKLKALKKADAPGKRPIIYAQMPVLKERFQKAYQKAVDAGLTREVDFKVNFVLIDSSVTLRKTLWLAGVHPDLDPEAKREIALWKAEEKLGGEALREFKIQWNADRLRFIKTLPGMTGVRHVSITKGGAEISRDVLSAAGLSPEDRLRNDQPRSEVRVAPQRQGVMAALKDQASILKLIENHFDISGAEAMTQFLKRGNTELFRNIALTLIHEFGISSQNEASIKKALNVARIVNRKGPGEWQRCRVVLEFFKQSLGFELKKLPAGRQRRIMTAVYGLGLSGVGFARFKDILALIEKETNLVVLNLKGVDKQRVVTAAFYLSRAKANPAKGFKSGGEYLQDFFDLLHNRYGILHNDRATMDTQMKIRLLTAAYSVALRKTAGFKTFNDTLAEVRRIFKLDPQNLRGNPAAQIRLITAAYEVSHGREAGLKAFLNTLEHIDTFFGIKWEDMPTLDDEDKMSLIAAAYGVSMGGSHGFQAFKGTIAEMGNVFDLMPEVIRGLELSEKIRLITAAYEVGRNQQEGIETFSNAIRYLADRFDMPLDDMKKLPLKDKLSIITVAYTISFNKAAGLDAFDKGMSLISRYFDLQSNQVARLERAEKIQLMRAVARISFRLAEGRLIFETVMGHLDALLRLSATVVRRMEVKQKMKLIIAASVVTQGREEGFTVFRDILAFTVHYWGRGNGIAEKLETFQKIDLISAIHSLSQHGKEEYERYAKALRFIGDYFHLGSEERHNLPPSQMIQMTTAASQVASEGDAGFDAFRIILRWINKVFTLSSKEKPVADAEQAIQFLRAAYHIAGNQGKNLEVFRRILEELAVTFGLRFPDLKTDTEKNRLLRAVYPAVINGQAGYLLFQALLGLLEEKLAISKNSLSGMQFKDKIRILNAAAAVAAAGDDGLRIFEQILTLFADAGYPLRDLSLRDKFTVIHIAYVGQSFLRHLDALDATENIFRETLKLRPAEDKNTAEAFRQFYRVLIKTYYRQQKSQQTRSELRTSITLEYQATMPLIAGIHKGYLLDVPDRMALNRFVNGLNADTKIDIDMTKALLLEAGNDFALVFKASVRNNGSSNVMIVVLNLGSSSLLGTVKKQFKNLGFDSFQPEFYEIDFPVHVQMDSIREQGKTMITLSTFSGVFQEPFSGDQDSLPSIRSEMRAPTGIFRIVSREKIRTFIIDKNIPDRLQVPDIETEVRHIAAERDYFMAEQNRLGNLVHELALNIHKHGQGGSIEISQVNTSDGLTGIELVGKDSGPGISDIPFLLQHKKEIISIHGNGFRIFGTEAQDGLIESKGKAWKSDGFGGFELIGTSPITQGAKVTLIVYQHDQLGMPVRVTTSPGDQKRSELRGKTPDFVSIWVSKNTEKFSNTAGMLTEIIREHWPGVLIKIIHGNENATSIKKAFQDKEGVVFFNADEEKNDPLNSFTFYLTADNTLPDHPWIRLRSRSPPAKITLHTHQPAKYLEAILTVDTQAVLKEFGLKNPPIVFANIHADELPFVVATLKHIYQNKLLDLEEYPIVVAPSLLNEKKFEETWQNAGIPYRLRKTTSQKNQNAWILVLNSTGELTNLLKAARLAVYGNTLLQNGTNPAHNLAESYAPVITGAFTNNDLSGKRETDSAMAVKAYADHGAVLTLGTDFTPEVLGDVISDLALDREQMSAMQDGNNKARRELYGAAQTKIFEVFSDWNKQLQERPKLRLVPRSQPVRSEMRNVQKQDQAIIAEEGIEALQWLLKNKKTEIFSLGVIDKILSMVEERGGVHLTANDIHRRLPRDYYNEEKWKQLGEGLFAWGQMANTREGAPSFIELAKRYVRILNDLSIKTEKKIKRNLMAVAIPLFVSSGFFVVSGILPFVLGTIISSIIAVVSTLYFFYAAEWLPDQTEERARQLQRVIHTAGLGSLLSGKEIPRARSELRNFSVLTLLKKISGLARNKWQVQDPFNPASGNIYVFDRLGRLVEVHDGKNPEVTWERHTYGRDGRGEFERIELKNLYGHEDVTLVLRKENVDFFEKYYEVEVFIEGQTHTERKVTFKEMTLPFFRRLTVINFYPIGSKEDHSYKQYYGRGIAKTILNALSRRAAEQRFSMVVWGILEPEVMNLCQQFFASEVFVEDKVRNQKQRIFKAGDWQPVTSVSANELLKRQVGATVRGTPRPISAVIAGETLVYYQGDQRIGNRSIPSPARSASSLQRGSEIPQNRAEMRSGSSSNRETNFIARLQEEYPFLRSLDYLNFAVRSQEILTDRQKHMIWRLFLAETPLSIAQFAREEGISGAKTAWFRFRNALWKMERYYEIYKAGRPLAPEHPVRYLRLNPKAMKVLFRLGISSMSPISELLAVSIDKLSRLGKAAPKTLRHIRNRLAVNGLPGLSEREKHLTDNDKIELLGLDVRNANALHRNGIRTIGELRALSKEQVNHLYDIGAKGKDNIIERLNAYGFKINFMPRSEMRTKSPNRRHLDEEDMPEGEIRWELQKFQTMVRTLKTKIDGRDSVFFEDEDTSLSAIIDQFQEAVTSWEQIQIYLAKLSSERQGVFADLIQPDLDNLNDARYEILGLLKRHILKRAGWAGGWAGLAVVLASKILFNDNHPWIFALKGSIALAFLAFVAQKIVYGPLFRKIRDLRIEMPQQRSEMRSEVEKRKGTLEQQIKALGILEVPDEKFRAVYQAAIKINPDLDLKLLAEVYQNVKQDLPRPAQAEEPSMVKILTAEWDARLDDLEDDRRFLGTLQQGTTKITEDSRLVFFKEKLGIPNAYFLYYRGIENWEPTRHYMNGVARDYWVVPKEFGDLMSLYCRAGDLLMRRILLNEFSDIEARVKAGTRQLGKGPYQPGMGNKEAGFLVFEKLGLPYPPGIVLSEDLVARLVGLPNEEAKKYFPFIDQQLRHAGIRVHFPEWWESYPREEALIIRSNPKQSMPGILSSRRVRYDFKGTLQETAQAWESEAAKKFRARERIPDKFDLPLIIQRWVSGQDPHRDPNSPRRNERKLLLYFSGVISTRDPNTNQDILFGRYLENAAGDELMTGGEAGRDIKELEQEAPAIFQQLLEARKKLEEAVGPQEFEFVVSGGKLYFTQTRKMNFSPQAEIAFLREQLTKGKISERLAIPRIEKVQERLRSRKLYKVKDPIIATPLTRGLASTPGALQGQLAWNRDRMEQLIAQKKPVVFVSHPGNQEQALTLLFNYPDSGLITSYGNSSSHEAVLTRLSGIPSLINLEVSRWDLTGKDQGIIFKNGQRLKEGDAVVLDGDKNILFISDQNVLEENGVVFDVSYGISIPDYRKEFLKPYLNPDGSVKNEWTQERLEVLNQEAEQKFKDLQHSQDKHAAFLANLEKHFLHDLLNGRKKIGKRSDFQILDEAQGVGGMKQDASTTAPSQRSEIRTTHKILDEAQLRSGVQKPQTSAAVSAPLVTQVSESEKQVATKAAEGVFRTSSALAMGQEILNRVLAELIPNAYAIPHLTRQRNYLALLSNKAKAETGADRIAVIFKNIPSLEDPSLQVLMQFMTRNKFAPVQIVVPHAAQTELTRFQQALIKKIMKMRDAKGVMGRGVNLVVISEKTEIAGFIQKTTERALVYDMSSSGTANLESLAPVVSKSGHADRTLLVYHDVDERQKAFALLGALNTILERKQIPQGIQPVSGILAFIENISIAAETRKVIEQAA
ncbi:MAG TPA: DNA-directed RNA polymerase subunit alpha C-terminal domain-containing protein [Candidatus Omnitrophota bacterium]|nr:DNA-directed RNA polymerase subunit alpha C-terminal domain-containing protein [Candidatus Omnitrophota bacterium]